MLDRESFVTKIRELKAILRIPRLYNAYKEKLQSYQRLDE